MIKRIELTNFMSHEHSIFELTSGLNVLVGPNNCGKSAVVSALQIVCYNESSRFAIRHDARQCSIEVESLEGDIVRWSRKRSGSPWYEINGERFDRLGKNGVPEKLHQVLRLDRVTSDRDRFDVHFGEQRSPVFLLNEKPRQAADFFASSSDARHLLEMQSLHKQKVREANTQKKQLDREVAEIKSQLARLEPVDELAAEIHEFEQFEKQIATRDEHFLHLRNLFQAIREQADARNHLEAQLECLSQIPATPELKDEFGLENHVQALARNSEKLIQLQNRLHVMGALQLPPRTTPVGEMETLVTRMEDSAYDLNYLSRKLDLLHGIPVPVETVDHADLQTLVGQMGDAIKADELLHTKIAAVDSRIEAVRGDVAKWARENPHCPTCGSAVTAEEMISTGGHTHG